LDPELDNLDTLSMSADDFGNSGGSELDQKSVHKQVNIRIEAVNDKPNANGPIKITVIEGIPFHFQRKPGTPLFVPDPDYADYGFNLRVFTVNLTCSNGRLYLNESFLKMPGVANNRISFRYCSEGSRSQGCEICPENTGSRFISIEDVFDDINEALSFVTYVPDPHFNTRSGANEEFIYFSVNDGGGFMNDASAPFLTDTLEIQVLAKSVND
jgi:hypothetical protein